MGLFQDGVYACPEGFMAGGQGSGPQGGGGIEPEGGSGFFGPVQNQVHMVCPQGGTFRTIQAAVDSVIVVDGDTLELCCDYPFTGELNRNIEFRGKRLVVRSECDDPTRCIIDCEGSSAGQREARRAFDISGAEYLGVTVRSVTVFDGLSWDSS